MSVLQLPARPQQELSCYASVGEIVRASKNSYNTLNKSEHARAYVRFMNLKYTVCVKIVPF